jgi:hypothetical protein
MPGNPILQSLSCAAFAAKFLFLGQQAIEKQQVIAH